MRHCLFALLAVTVGACTPAARPTITPPSGVLPFVEERGFETNVLAAEADLLPGLTRQYGRVQRQRWEVPRAVSWEQVSAYYVEELGPGWKPDPQLANERTPYRRSVWHQSGGLFRRSRVFALTWLDGLPADFAVLIVAQSATD